MLCCPHSLKLFLGEGAEPQTYQGSRDLHSLYQFVMDGVSAGDAAGSKEGDKEVKEEEEEGEERKRRVKEEEGMPGGATAVEIVRDIHGIVHLTDENFKSYIDAAEGIVFVKFYAPWLVDEDPL